VKSLTDQRVPISKLVWLSVALIILIILPWIIESPYIMHLLIMFLILAVLGMTFSMLFNTGLITLGAAAFYGIGAYASALSATKLGLSFWLALPLATLITAILALALGAIIVRHAGVAFVIITMLFAHVIVQVTGQVELFGGWGGILGIPRPGSIGPIEFAGKIPCYYLMLFLSLLIALIFYALYTCRVGRVWRTIKLSPPLAETLGINLYRYRLLAFVIGSSAAGAVGSFYAHYFGVLTPGTFGGWTSIYIQLYAVLGGLEFYILGPAIGAAIMTFLPEFLRIAKEVEPIITGALLLIIILFFPGGILGTLQTFPRLRLASMSAQVRKIRAWLSSGDKLRR